MLNTIMQLITNLSKIFKKYNNQKSAKFSLSYYEQMKILEHISNKMNVTLKYFIEMQNKAFITTQNIIEQQEIMKLIEIKIYIKMSSMLISMLT